jgi:hypothetical protein
MSTPKCSCTSTVQTLMRTKRLRDTTLRSDSSLYGRKTAKEQQHHQAQAVAGRMQRQIGLLSQRIGSRKAAYQVPDEFISIADSTRVDSTMHQPYRSCA